MASRNADRQRRYRQRLSARGLVHVQGWATPAQAEMIRRILTEGDGEVLVEGWREREREVGNGANQRPA